MNRTALKFLYTCFFALGAQTPLEAAERADAPTGHIELSETGARKPARLAAVLASQRIGSSLSPSARPRLGCPLGSKEALAEQLTQSAALCKACASNDLKAVMSLLMHGAPVNNQILEELSRGAYSKEIVFYLRRRLRKQ